MRNLKGILQLIRAAGLFGILFNFSDGDASSCSRKGRDRWNCLQTSFSGNTHKDPARSTTDWPSEFVRTKFCVHTNDSYRGRRKIKKRNEAGRDLLHAGGLYDLLLSSRHEKLQANESTRRSDRRDGCARILQTRRFYSGREHYAVRQLKLER